MMGPAGPRGERGSAGAEGPPGLPGVPGSPGNDVSVPPWLSCNQATPSLAVRGGHERFFTSICPTYKCTDTAGIFTSSRVRVLAFQNSNIMWKAVTHYRIYFLIPFFTSMFCYLNNIAQHVFCCVISVTTVQTQI